MVGAVRIALVARAAAVVIAVALSGAPRVVALRAPVEGHRCSCRAHGAAHACDCAMCRRAALAAQAADERQPPCHRASARKALAEREPRGPSRSEPCVEGTCGGSSAAAAVPGATDPFFSPTAWALRFAIRAELLTLASEAARERPADPETPPPRPA